VQNANDAEEIKKLEQLSVDIEKVTWLND